MDVDGNALLVTFQLVIPFDSFACLQDYDFAIRKIHDLLARPSSPLPACCDDQYVWIGLKQPLDMLQLQRVCLLNRSSHAVAADLQVGDRSWHTTVRDETKTADTEARAG